MEGPVLQSNQCSQRVQQGNDRGTDAFHKQICTTVFLDDISILSRNQEEHLEHLRLVFQRLQEAGFKVKLKKCHLLAPEVKFLGHVISHEGVKADPEKLTSVAQWEQPKDRIQLQQFLGLLNYFRRFVPNLSRATAPLYHLTKKQVSFVWDAACIQSFNAIKVACTCIPRP